MFQLPLQAIIPTVGEGIIREEKEEIAILIAKKEEINGIIPGKRRDKTER